MSNWFAYTKKTEPFEQHDYHIGATDVIVPWRDLACGMSFTIPTTASATEVADILSPAANFFKYKLRTEEIIWYKMTAVRVHRIA